MDQKRLFIAFALSAAILFGWTYFIDRTTPKPNNANSPTVNANNPATTSSASPAPQATATVATPASSGTVMVTTPDNVPQRSVKVVTPLYEVKLDSQGAVVTSWVITRKRDMDNRVTGQPLYSVAGDKNNRQPLELIPAESVRQKSPGVAPLLLTTGDATVDALLASKNFKVGGVDGESGEARVEVKNGESKQLDFTMRDEATGLDVVKTLRFDASTYSVDLGVKLTRGGQAIQNTRLAIGPSIGDQGVPHYTFYSVAPEGVAAVGGKPQLFYGTSIHSNEGSQDRQVVGGTIDWAGVCDTYFAMVAVPSKPTDGLEFRTVKYEHEGNGKKEDRFLLTAYVNVPADGSPTHLYVGPKDHDLLDQASAEIGKTVNREIDLGGLINYGWLGRFTRPLAYPILRAISYLHKLTGSYGVAIILFTIIIYSLFFPLKWRSSKSMKKAQKLAPRMKEVQEKIKSLKPNDPRLKELQMEQLRLMKEGNILGGCLPLLIQMPFLIALYSAITISIDFRQATFLWLPDLSAADPYRLLPILMAGSMVVLQFITPAPSADPLQRKMMAVVMPAFMLYILWSAPAGLLVYWIVGNIVGFTQQMVINRLVKSEDDEEPPEKKKAESGQTKKLHEARAS
ncbi:MAG TPA: membrane protein insertase YidC [Pyrinomonadaceae bacterium]|jgi:YidC/Oxa1 family membrane protein insertase|nr:membrane protein insertase YidC [Pyrinomonadaceae bacterium]